MHGLTQLFRNYLFRVWLHAILPQPRSLKLTSSSFYHCSRHHHHHHRHHHQHRYRRHDRRNHQYRNAHYRRRHHHQHCHHLVVIVGGSLTLVIYVAYLPNIYKHNIVHNINSKQTDQTCATCLYYSIWTGSKS